MLSIHSLSASVIVDSGFGSGICFLVLSEENFSKSLNTTEHPEHWYAIGYSLPPSGTMLESPYTPSYFVHPQILRLKFISSVIFTYSNYISCGRTFLDNASFREPICDMDCDKYYLSGMPLYFRYNHATPTAKTNH